MLQTGFLSRETTLFRKPCRYQVYVPPGFSADRAWPVILFLHNNNEGGRDGLRQTEVGIGPAIRRNPERFPAVVVFPQAPLGYPWRGPTAGLALKCLDHALEEFRGDPDRVYLTGVTLGGYGTWRLALRNPNRFAALVPIGGGLDVPGQRNVMRPTDLADPLPEPYLEAARKLKHLSTWLFHGEEDSVISVSESRVMALALQQVGAPVRYTEYPDVNHMAWEPAYAEPELLPWLLSQRRKG